MASLLVINRGKKRRRKARRNPDLLVVNPNAEMPAGVVIALLGLGGLAVCGAICGGKKAAAAPAVEAKPAEAAPAGLVPAVEEELIPELLEESGIWA